MLGHPSWTRLLQIGPIQIFHYLKGRFQSFRVHPLLQYFITIFSLFDSLNKAVLHQGLEVLDNR